MADFNLYFPKLLKYEGGYTNDPDDKGGPTKYGITLQTWIEYGYDKTGDGKIDKDDIKVLEVQEAARIARNEYWSYIGADSISSQPIAEIIVDWCYTSGGKNVVSRIQKILGFKKEDIDGVSGPQTRKEINNADQEVLFSLIKTARINYYQNITKARPSQKKFLKGWINRTEQFVFVK